jgi:hypothetical protein
MFAGEVLSALPRKVVFAVTDLAFGEGRREESVQNKPPRRSLSR